MNDKELPDPDFLGFDTDSKLKGSVKLSFGDYSLPALGFDVEPPASSHKTRHLDNQIPQVIYNVRNKNKLF
jgi:hypothetical protein